MGDNNNDDLFFSIVETAFGDKTEDALDFDEEKTIGDLFNHLKETYEKPTNDFPAASIVVFSYSYKDEAGKQHKIPKTALLKKDMKDMKLRDLYKAHGKITDPTFHATFTTAEERAEKKKESAERAEIKRLLGTRGKRRSRSTQRRSTRRRH
jgi:hypothetical protein